VTTGTFEILVTKVIMVSNKSMVMLVTMVNLKAKVTIRPFETLVTKVSR